MMPIKKLDLTPSLRAQKIDKLMSKEKHGAIFATLDNILMSNKMLTDAKTIISHAFFRFARAARVDALPTPANIQQSYEQSRTMCQRCDKHTEPTLVHILNDCQAIYPERTRRHNKVIDLVGRAIEEHMVNRLH
jgi:hypothetical protein